MWIRYVGMLVLCWILSASMACQPPWPSCQKDTECSSHRRGNTSGRAFFCIQGRCQPCRTIQDCPQPDLYKCSGYQCIRKTCADISCKGIKRCNPDSLQCEWICTQNGTTPCDGDACKICQNHMCIYKQPNCLSSADCPHDEICAHAGTCNAVCRQGCDRFKCKEPYECYEGQCIQPCTFQNVFFAGTHHTLNQAALHVLNKLLPCLYIRKTKKLWIQAHYIAGKTREYDLHKSLERAQQIRTFFMEKKIPKRRLCLIAKGHEELLYSDKNATTQERKKNQRVSFQLADECP